jgi:spermidine synthase
VLLAIAFLTGLSSFIYEIAWIRSLSLVLGASTNAFELMLASFILGLALGGLWIRKRIDRIGDVIRFLAIVQILMGLFALATLPVYNSTFDLMSWLLGAIRRTDSGWIVFNFFSTVLCLLVMLPATFLAGMTLPLITFALLRSRMGEKSIGHVYASNTLGGIIGVIVAVHFALPALGLKGALVLGGAIDVALGVFLLVRASGSGRRANLAWSTAGLAGVVAAMLLFHLDPLKLASSVYRFGKASLPDTYRILYHHDGKTATVDVFEHMQNGQITIATNGKADGAISSRMENGLASDEHTMVLLGALPLAHRPDAKNVALIGYGTGMSTTTILGSPNLERVDTIEIEPSMPEGARHFEFFTRAAYTDPRSRIVIDDAKSYFARSQRRYDVIVSEPSNPWVSGVSSLFTREFYARIRGQLASGGILVQWLHLYSFNDDLLASVLAALRESFPAFVVYASTSGDIVVVASHSGPVPPLRGDLFAMERVRASLARIDVRRVEDLGLRRVGDNRTMQAMFQLQTARANSDYFPLVDTNAPKARFTEARVKDLSELATAPWPVLEMTAHDPPPASYPVTLAKSPAGERVIEAQRAEYARRFLLGEAQDPAAREQLGDHFRSLSIFKSRFVDCSSRLAPADVWYDAIATAGLISVYLSPAAAEGVWTRVQNSACHGKLDARTRGWIALFRALGNRDHEAVAALATRLLESPESPVEVEYLYGAAMTALIGSGRNAEMRQLFNDVHGKIARPRRELGWFRWFAGAAIQGEASLQSAAMPVAYQRHDALRP